MQPINITFVNWAGWLQSLFPGTASDTYLPIAARLGHGDSSDHAVLCVLWDSPHSDPCLAEVLRVRTPSGECLPLSHTVTGNLHPPWNLLHPSLLLQEGSRRSSARTISPAVLFQQLLDAFAVGPGVRSFCISPTSLAQMAIVLSLGWWAGVIDSFLAWRPLAAGEFGWGQAEAGQVGRGWGVGNRAVWLTRHWHWAYSMPVLSM